MTILEMLNRLAEIAPDVCRATSKVHYIIGEYTFYQHSQYGFMATKAETPGHMFTGRPALAWLADAIMAECERLKLSFESEFWFYNNTPRWRIYSIFLKKNFVSTENYTEALLAAFLAAVEGER